MKTHRVTGQVNHEVGLYLVKLDSMVLGTTETETNMVQTMIMITKALKKSGAEVEVKVEQI